MINDSYEESATEREQIEANFSEQFSEFGDIIEQFSDQSQRDEVEVEPSEGEHRATPLEYQTASDASQSQVAKQGEEGNVVDNQATKSDAQPKLGSQVGDLIKIEFDIPPKEDEPPEEEEEQPKVETQLDLPKLEISDLDYQPDSSYFKPEDYIHFISLMHPKDRITIDRNILNLYGYKMIKMMQTNMNVDRYVAICKIFASTDRHKYTYALCKFDTETNLCSVRVIIHSWDKEMASFKLDDFCKRYATWDVNAIYLTVRD